MSERPNTKHAVDEGSRPPESGLHQEVQYEASEVSVIGLIAVLVAFAIVFAGVFLVSGWFLKANESSADRMAESPQYNLPAEPKPGQPRLEPLDYETAVVSNVFAGQLAKEHRLHTYGTTNESGYVHIPVEKAIRLVLKSLPARQGTVQPPAKSFGLAGGGESNSGRLYLEAPQWLTQKK